MPISAREALGEPFVIPTIHACQGDQILLHGLSGGRMLDHIEAGNPVAMAMTIVDGLVCARTAFNHSMNFRSVIIFGTGRVIDDPKEKLEGLRCLSERVIPGRWQHVRPPNDKEIKATSLVAMEMHQASAKIRRGPPGDDGEDLQFPVWAGLLPLAVVPQPAEADPKMHDDYPVPDHVTNFRCDSR